MSNGVFFPESYHIRERRISESYADIRLPIVLCAIACQIVGMSILRTLATCGFTAFLFTACVLRCTKIGVDGLSLSPYLKNTKILMCLAMALLLEPPIYYFGFYLGYVIYLLPRALLLEVLYQQLPKDCLPLPVPDDTVEPPPPEYTPSAPLTHVSSAAEPVSSIHEPGVVPVTVGTS